MGVLELAGCVANHKPAIERAKFLRTVLHLLGLPNVPVAVGSEGTAKKEDREKYYYELRNLTFSKQKWNEESFKEGKQLIKELVEQEGKAPLTVLLISSLQDISEYFDYHQDQEFLESHFKNLFPRVDIRLIAMGR
jgi:hypothetical protein